MQRRMFLKVGAASAAAVAAGPTVGLLSGCSTDWVTVVENDLPTVVNIISSVVSVVATATGNGALNSAVAAVISEAVKVLVAGLATFKDAVDAYNSNKSQSNLAGVIAALQAAQADAQKVIEALPAGNEASTIETIIVAALGTAITVLSSIQAIIPGGLPNLTAGYNTMVVKEKVVLPNAAAFKAGFNAVLVVKGYPGHQVK
jgi:hypothetical protein